MLSKSKYGIVRDYTINFKEIDVPTEKERAEINNLKATTISTYLQSGIITEEEARNNLIKDPDSGFNDITDELPEGDLFGEEEGEGGESLQDLVNDPTVSASEAATLNGVQVTSMVNIASQVAKNELSRESAIAILQKSFNMNPQEAEAIIGNEKLPEEGGSSNEQNPFSMDDDDDWRTTENGVHFPLKEGESVKESCKEHFEDKEQHEKDMKNSFNAQADMMTLLAMDYPEFKETVSGINTVYDSKYKNEKVIEHHTPGFIYFADNEGFNNYKFYDKIINEDIDRNL